MIEEKKRVEIGCGKASGKKGLIDYVVSPSVVVAMMCLLCSAQQFRVRMAAWKSRGAVVRRGSGACEEVCARC